MNLKYIHLKFKKIDKNQFSALGGHVMVRAETIYTVINYNNNNNNNNDNDNDNNNNNNNIMQLTLTHLAYQKGEKSIFPV